MPDPRPKFTQDRKERILEALRVGTSQETAAHIAGISKGTLSRWLSRGREAEPGSNYHDFYLEVRKAEAEPKMRALGVIHKAMLDDPKLAWKFIERREPGFAPPQIQAPQAPQGPVVIQLTLADGTLPALGMPSTPEPIDIQLAEVASVEDSEAESSEAGTPDQASAAP